MSELAPLTRKEVEAWPPLGPMALKSERVLALIAELDYARGEIQRMTGCRPADVIEAARAYDRRLDEMQAERDKLARRNEDLEALIPVASELGLEIEQRTAPLVWALKNVRAQVAEAALDSARFEIEDLRRELEQARRDLSHDRTTMRRAAADIDVATEKVAALIVEREELKGQVAFLGDALWRDDVGMSKVLGQIRAHVSARTWLLEGRGAYEWDDNRYKEEAGEAMRPVLELVELGLSSSGELLHPTLRDVKAGAARWLEGVKLEAREAGRGEGHATRRELDAARVEVNEWWMRLARGELDLVRYAAIRNPDAADPFTQAAFDALIAHDKRVTAESYTRARAMHFAGPGAVIACGAGGATTSTDIAEKVTCRRCLVLALGWLDPGAAVALRGALENRGCERDGRGCSLDSPSNLCASCSALAAVSPAPPQT